MGLLLWGLLNQWVIVFVNDLADVDTDRDNSTFNLTSGGSRVLVDGSLSPRDLRIATAFITVLWSAVTGWMAITWNLPGVGLALLAAIALLSSYSLKPIRLSYRGGGEVLQAIGVGVVLPCLGYYAQSGGISSISGLALASTFILGLASGITTSLPDTPSDARSQKRTISVLHGQSAARILSLLLIAAAIGLTASATSSLEPNTRLAIVALPLVLLLSNIPRRKRSDARHIAQCKRFVITNLACQVSLLVAWTLALWLGL